MTRWRGSAPKTAFVAAVAFTLTFGLVTGCTNGPWPSSSAEPSSSSTDFPKALMSVLTKLVEDDIPKNQPELALKYALFSNALSNLDFKAAGHTSVSRLNNVAEYELSSSSQPGYFGKGFQKNKVDVTAVDSPHGRYDYDKNQGPGSTWVDFAAINLGGGAFHDGFAQEETMTLEMPELANVVASGGNFTRSSSCDPKHGTDGPLQCNPTPLFIGPVHRTMEISTDLNGNTWRTTPPSKLFSSKPLVKLLDKNFELNVLAVAVANLSNGAKPAAKTTIEDLFNTFVAAFTLAKQNKADTINTGGIGTGVFQNDPKVVYVMQKLAAMHVGVKLRYYGTTDQKNWDPVVDAIIADYDKSSTHTVKHLLELACDKFANGKCS